jgi:hypothetical protein
VVEEAIVALATSGAVAVVAAMATDAWESARAGIVHVFRPDDGETPQDIETQLDADQTLVVEAGDAADETRQDLVPAWRRRLLRLLEGYPKKVGELRTLVAGLEESHGSDQRAWVQNITARDNGIAVGAQNGDVHFHAALPDHGPWASGSGHSGL